MHYLLAGIIYSIYVSKCLKSVSIHYKYFTLINLQIVGMADNMIMTSASYYSQL